MYTQQSPGGSQLPSPVIEVVAGAHWAVYCAEASRRWIGVCDRLRLCLEADSTDELRELIEDATGLAGKAGMWF